MNKDELRLCDSILKVALGRLTATINDLDRIKQVITDKALLVNVDEVRARLLWAEVSISNSTDRVQVLNTENGKENGS